MQLLHHHYNISNCECTFVSFFFYVCVSSIACDNFQTTRWSLLKRNGATKNYDRFSGHFITFFLAYTSKKNSFMAARDIVIEREQLTTFLLANFCFCKKQTNICLLCINRVAQKINALIVYPNFGGFLLCVFTKMNYSFFIQYYEFRWRIRLLLNLLFAHRYTSNIHKTECVIL